MRKAILYVSALDEYGKLCFAFNEDKSLKKKYFCPECGIPMTLKKSESKSKYAKRPHFEHPSKDVCNCNPEIVLHNTFKTKFYEILKDRINNNESFNFNWNCTVCHKEHSDNLLKSIEKVSIENELGDYCPDILLTDKNGMPFIAIDIEVIDTPYPYFKQQYNTHNDILLYKINLQSDEELKNIAVRAAQPDFFDFCTRPKCKVCGKYMNQREIFIKETECWHCGTPMLIAEGVDDKSGSFYPDYFKKEEIEFASDNGVYLQNNYSKTIDKTYLSNTCPKCGKISGNYCLMETGMEVEMAIKNSKTFYYCDNCEYKATHPYNGVECPKCNRPQITRTIKVFKTTCQTCNTPIIVATGEEDCDNAYKAKEIYPHQFSQEQVHFANCNGANVAEIKSSLYKHPFYTNICPKCGTIKNRGDENTNGKIISEKYFGRCDNCEPIKDLIVDNTDEICEKCNTQKSKRTVIVVEAFCTQCNKLMNVAFVKEPGEVSCFDNANSYLVPHTTFNFNQEQKQFAQKNGVVFNGKGMIICPHCNALAKKYSNQYEDCKEIAHDSIIYCRSCDDKKKDNQNQLHNNRTITSDLEKIIEENPLPNIDNISLADLFIPQDSKHPHKKAK